MDQATANVPVCATPADTQATLYPPPFQQPSMAANTPPPSSSGTIMVPTMLNTDIYENGFASRAQQSTPGPSRLRRSARSRTNPYSRTAPGPSMTPVGFEGGQPSGFTTLLLPHDSPPPQLVARPFLAHPIDHMADLRYPPNVLQLLECSRSLTTSESIEAEVERIQGLFPTLIESVGGKCHWQLQLDGTVRPVIQPPWPWLAPKNYLVLPSEPAFFKKPLYIKCMILYHRNPTYKNKLVLAWPAIYGKFYGVVQDLPALWDVPGDFERASRVIGELIQRCTQHSLGYEPLDVRAARWLSLLNHLHDLLCVAYSNYLWNAQQTHHLGAGIPFYHATLADQGSQMQLPVPIQTVDNVQPLQELGAVQVPLPEENESEVVNWDSEQVDYEALNRLFDGNLGETPSEQSQLITSDSGVDVFIKPSAFDTTAMLPMNAAIGAVGEGGDAPEAEAVANGQDQGMGAMNWGDWTNFDVFDGSAENQSAESFTEL